MDTDFEHITFQIVKEIKAKFDKRPKFDPNLGVLNVYYPPEVSFSLKDLFYEYKIKLNDIKGIFDSLKTIGIIDDYYFESKLGNYCIVKLPKEFEKVFISFNNSLQEKNPILENLYLDNSGNLWREPKDNSKILSLEQNSKRHKILKYLTLNKDYQMTDDILRASDGKNEQSVRVQIGYIRKGIKEHLGIPGKRVLEGKKGSGYRINPNFKINLV